MAPPTPTHDLINPDDPPAYQREKLLQIADALMRRVEQATDDGGAAYTQFQRAVLLEDQVRERTRDLERALDLLNLSNARLAEANRATEAARRNLSNAIETVQEGFALFDSKDALVLCNSRFGMFLRDLAPVLHPGLSFDDYVTRVSLSPHLTLPPGDSPAQWAARRLRQHHERHVMFNARMDGDHWVQVSEHRMPDGGTVILQTDVTDIIRLERQERGKMLDAQAKLIRATLEHLNQGVCIFDAEQRLVGWNRKLGNLLGIPLPRLRLGASFDGLLDRFADGARFRDITRQAVADWAATPSPRAALRFTVERGQAPLLILDVYAQEMPNGGFVISFTDITAERDAIAALSRANETLEARVTERTMELEDAALRAERANATRARFVAAASHDLLQPLSAARLFVAAAESDTLAPDTRDALQKAQSALDSVDGILGALLDISRLDSGKAAVSSGPVDLGAMLAQLGVEFGPIAAAKGLRFRIRPVQAQVISDPSYLRRILQNLISNALRYTASGGVLVGVRPRGRMIQLEVWDSGPGIAEDDQEAVFQEFHRLNARASASDGMGLGLAIVERAAALLGHPLGLKSRLGRGSCFLLQLPLTAPPASPAPATPAPQSALDSKIVLLVEPDPELRRALSMLMEKWGISVLDTESMGDALALIDEIGITPDALILDHGTNGAETADFQKQIQSFTGRFGPLPLALIGAGLPGLAQATRLAKPIDARAVQSFLSAAFTES
ncbi:PAS domain-containing protein [Pseudorhodobacter sp. E13]|uniref:hybrid sensor histidine kinase/response regulator n=1 Tax=Pseudorhodobacter sp. E13 TaxID=2487931 RepID=UPI000F8DD926|nr:PAS-domain containing protein [Pseudorhodobacter sp. E13]RUS60488.1 PAS domain-containing protein [Pseudorhodobacter sp. E13]